MKLALPTFLLLISLNETSLSKGSIFDFTGDKLNGAGTLPDDSCKNFNVKILDKKNVACYGESNGSIVVSSDNAASPVSYFWNIPGSTDSSLIKVRAGWYDVLAIDKRGCRDSLAIYVSEPSMLYGYIISAIDVSCRGSNDGKATLSVNGGTQPYNYSWNTNPKQTGSTVFNLPRGYFIAKISDANLCSTFVAVNIDEPPPLNISVTNMEGVSCYGGNNGQVSVKVWGGIPSYEVVWNTTPNQTGLSLSNLKSGVYRVTATDSVNCVISTQIQITEPPPLTFSIDSIRQASCPGSKDGSAFFTVNGGTTPYQYIWNSTPVQYTPKVIGIKAGNYMATLVDANGCRVQESLTISEPEKIKATIVTTDVSCYGLNDGVAGVAVGGGMWPYSIRWNTTPAQTGYSANNLKAGFHQVTITDKNNCSLEEYFVIDEPSRLDVSDIFLLNASCFNRNDGNAVIRPKGGQKPYAFYWQTTPVQTTPEAKDLFAGTYKVWVFDANSCSDSVEITIAHPDKLKAFITSKKDVSCFNFSDGRIEVNTSDGVKPIRYAWSNGSTDSKIENIRQGHYQVMITDGCMDTIVLSANIEQPLPFKVSDISGPKISAVGLTETFSITENVGWSYVWGAKNASLVNANGKNEATFRFQNPSESRIFLTVTNESGCKDTLNHSVKLFNDCFQIFPNPSRGATSIFVPIADGQRVIEIVNTMGVVVKSFVAERLNEIDLSDWPGGLYYIKVDACMLKFMKETGWDN
jgi:hypothetical protein